MEYQRVAWITGAGRGIGRAIAHALATEGYKIALSARSERELELVASEIRQAGEEALVVPCDVSAADQVSAAHDTILREFGDPTLLVNNAGVSPWSTFSEMTVEEFDAAVSINMRSMFLCSKAVLPSMYQAKRGAIIQILSVASIKAYKNGAAYVASKFGSLGFTNALREEARKHGVRVLAVMPGAVETELWGQEERERSRDRMMQPDDIAAMIVAGLREPDRALVEEILIRPIGGDI